MSITLTDHQADAIKQVVSWFKQAEKSSEPKPLYFGGFGGTGKTALLPFIIEALKLDTSEIVICSITGKACRVAGVKLKKAGLNITPKTIHSLIYRPKALKAETLDAKIKELQKALHLATEYKTDEVYYEGKKLNLKDAQRTLKILNEDLDKAFVSTDGPKWQLNVESPIREASLIIVDEASLVGEMIANDLKSFGIPILAIGDPGQLSPVGDKAGFCIGKPDVFLTEIHRQARDNPIIALATHVREGGMLEVGTWGDTVKIVRRKDDTDSYDTNKNLQVLCGTHKKRWSLTKKIREAMGHSLIGPAKDEPLICRKNSRTSETLVNGMLMYCEKDYELIHGKATFNLSITDEDEVRRNIITCQALFEEHYARQAGYFSCEKRAGFEAKKKHHHVDWAWALTIHSAQGSQWDHVVVHDESNVFRQESEKWLYTAVTRAAEKLTVVI